MESYETHVELASDEFFLTNSSPEDVHRIQYATKRIGKNAYDVYGKKQNGLVPVFVKKDDYRKTTGDEFPMSAYGRQEHEEIR